MLNGDGSPYPFGPVCVRGGYMSPLDASVRRGRWVICFHDQDSSRTPLVIAWLFGAMQIVQIKSGFLRALTQISVAQDVIKRRLHSPT